MSAAVLAVFGLGAVVGKRRAERKSRQATACVQNNSAYEIASKGFGRNTVKRGGDEFDDDDEVLLGGSDEDGDDVLLGR